MKRISVIGIVTVLLLALATNFVMAAGPCIGKGGKSGKGGDCLVDLDLSYEQQEKILEIRQRYTREIQPICHDLQKKRLELKKLWGAKNPSQNAIIAKRQQMVADQVKLQFKKRAVQEEIKKVLTPEQLKKFETKTDCFQGFKSGRRHGRREKPGSNRDRTVNCQSQSGSQSQGGCH